MLTFLCFGGSDCIVPMRRKPRLESIKNLYQANWQARLDWCLTALGTAGVEPTSTIKSVSWKLPSATKFKHECSATNAWLTANQTVDSQSGQRSGWPQPKEQWSILQADRKPDRVEH